MQSRARRGAFVVALVLILVAGAALGLRALYNAAKTQLAGPTCNFGDYSVDTGQASVASSMVGVVSSRGLPERAAVLVLAAAMQESKLRNLDGGDRDSVGVLQQRPSQGWGTPEQLKDVRYATGAFLDQLVKKAGWQTRPLSQVVQDVQVSADGSAYAKHEQEAQQLSDALLGITPAGLSCSFDKPSKIAPAATVAALLRKDLPVNPPRTDGRTITVPGAKWQTASWFVANADRLGVDAVAFSGRRWTRAKGWKTWQAGSTAVVATMSAP